MKTLKQRINSALNAIGLPPKEGKTQAEKTAEMIDDYNHHSAEDMIPPTSLNNLKTIPDPKCYSLKTVPLFKTDEDMIDPLNKRPESLSQIDNLDEIRPGKAEADRDIMTSKFWEEEFENLRNDGNFNRGSEEAVNEYYDEVERRVRIRESEELREFGKTLEDQVIRPEDFPSVLIAEIGNDNPWISVKCENPESWIPLDLKNNNEEFIGHYNEVSDRYHKGAEGLETALVTHWRSREKPQYLQKLEEELIDLIADGNNPASSQSEVEIKDEDRLNSLKDVLSKSINAGIKSFKEGIKEIQRLEVDDSANQPFKQIFPIQENPPEYLTRISFSPGGEERIEIKPISPQMEKDLREVHNRRAFLKKLEDLGINDDNIIDVLKETYPKQLGDVLKSADDILEEPTFIQFCKENEPKENPINREAFYKKLDQVREKISKPETEAELLEKISKLRDKIDQLKDPIDFKALRTASRLTLREVEKSTGISNAYLSQLENGKIKKPSYDTVCKLTEFYNSVNGTQARREELVERLRRSALSNLEKLTAPEIPTDPAAQPKIFENTTDFPIPTDKKTPENDPLQTSGDPIDLNKYIISEIELTDQLAKLKALILLLCGRVPFATFEPLVNQFVKVEEIVKERLKEEKSGTQRDIYKNARGVIDLETFHKLQEWIVERDRLMSRGDKLRALETLINLEFKDWIELGEDPIDTAVRILSVQTPFKLEEPEFKAPEYEFRPDIVKGLEEEFKRQQIKLIKAWETATGIRVVRMIDNGNYHLMISHPDRIPSRDEILWSRYEFTPNSVPNMGEILNGSDKDSKTIHLWEIRKG